MCWPYGKAERRYAGVTHIDVQSIDENKIQNIHQLIDQTGVEISGLGYYPNPLVADLNEAQVYINHIKKVIQAAEQLNVPIVNTFVGRDPYPNG